MPSNAELRETAGELAYGLGITVNTDGLKNAELQDLVSDLHAKVKDAAHETQADTAPAVEPEPEPKGFFVAEGKSITSKKGLLDAGDEVKPGALSTESFEKLFDLGFIVEK